MRKLELAPRSPFHDIEGFVAKIKAAHPGLSDRGINQAVKRSLDGYKPRHPGRVVHMYGADIMTATLEGIAAWPHMTLPEQRRIPQYPTHGGATIDPANVEASQVALASRTDWTNINRSVLISPRGLQCSYVWRLTNDWVQEVTDHDFDLILAVQGNRRMFRDPDIHGPYVPVRSYDAPPAATYITRTQRDVEHLMSEMTRRPSWPGVDIQN